MPISATVVQCHNVLKPSSSKTTQALLLEYDNDRKQQGLKRGSVLKG